MVKTADKALDNEAMLAANEMAVVALTVTVLLHTAAALIWIAVNRLEVLLTAQVIAAAKAAAVEGKNAVTVLEQTAAAESAKLVLKLAVT